jgi:hypothetical protein
MHVCWRSDIAVGRLNVFRSVSGIPSSSSKVLLLQEENLQAKNRRWGEACRIIHITPASLKIDTNLSGNGKSFE